jgi:cytochrome c biogenesis protein CcdA
MANKFRIDYEGKNDNIKEEVESIRNSYLEKSSSQKKLEELRKIDSKVKNTPLIIALSFGIIGTLVFGFGMSLILEFKNYIFGIIVSIIGMILIALAYPIYSILLKKFKNKYKDKILELSNELINE